MTRVTWILQRRGLLAMSIFGVLDGALQAGAYVAAAGDSAASRAAFGLQMEALGASLSYLLPLPTRVDTIAGYLQWRVYGALPLVFGCWALFSAAGATRGDEERGLVDQWTGAGVEPGRYLLARFAGFAVAAALAAASTSTAVAIGAYRTGSPLPATAVAEVSVALVAVTLACYAIASVVSQFASTRSSSAGIGGALLLVLLLLNGFGRTVAGPTRAAAALSPFHYYDRSDPLTPGGHFDIQATLGLFALAVVLILLAGALMTRRDLGSVALARRAAHTSARLVPSANPMLRIPVLGALYEQRTGLLAWTLGTGLGAAFIASLGRQLVDLVKAPGGFQSYLTAAGHGDPYVALTGFFWFGIFELLLAVFAITQVSRWAADDAEGRLETLLRTPTSRTRVVIERAAALALGAVAMIVVSSTALYVSARAGGIQIRASDLFVASLPLVPFCLTFAAVGSIIASRAPRLAVTVLTVLAGAGYLVTQFGPLLKAPGWVGRLSVFELLGNPLANGIDRGGLGIMLAVTIGGFAVAAVLMQGRDVGS